MKRQRIKIVNPVNAPTSIRTKCYIDEKAVNVKSVDFRVAVDEVPTFTFETTGIPDIDISGDIQFRFTPETVQQAAVVLQNEFKNSAASRSALIASIDSVLQEESSEYLTENLAEQIADRIIGL